MNKFSTYGMNHMENICNYKSGIIELNKVRNREYFR